MARWVLLKEVLMHPEKYGDISERQIDYIPDYRKITLSKKQTGVEIPQMFETEVNHTWYATLHEGKIYLVTGETTTQNIQFRGRVGYKNREEVQKELSKIFKNKELGTKGEIWSEDTIDIAIKILPKRLRLIKGIYCTAMEYSHKLGNYCFFGLKLIDCGTLYGSGSNGGCLFTNYDDNVICAASVRPLLYVPENVLVDIGEIDGKAPLKIKLPNKN